MSRKLNTVSVIFALIVLVIASSSAMAQVQRLKSSGGGDVGVNGRPTLGCCKCLGGSNTLDLSTISANNWTVNGSPVVALTAIHPYWNINPGPAQWVSTVATAGTGSLAAGTYTYSLDFVVPACSIDQKVTVTGNYGGDDDVQVLLDNALISQCTGGWCFNTPKKTLSTFSAAILIPGTHTLTVKVKNDGLSPSGMFVNAKLTGTCTSEPTKPR